MFDLFCWAFGSCVGWLVWRVAFVCFGLDLIVYCLGLDVGALCRCFMFVFGVGWFMDLFCMLF